MDNKFRIVIVISICFMINAALPPIMIPNATAETVNIDEYFVKLARGTYSDGIWSISWSPDGSKLVAGLRDSTVIIINAMNGTKLKTLSGHTDHVYSVEWCPKGDKIASGSWDGTVKIWDAETGIMLHNFTGDYGLNESEVRAVTWSPNGYLVAGGGSVDQTIKVWNVTTWNEVANFTGHTDSIESLAWSPDGSFLASGSGWKDTTIKIWDTTTWTEVKNISGHTGEVQSLDWSSDSNMLLSTEGYKGGTPDKVIHIWDVVTGSIIRNITANAIKYYAIHSADFSPDDLKIVAGTWHDLNNPGSSNSDNVILIWDASDGTLLKTISGHTYGVMSTKWSPDGLKVASGSLDHTIQIWGSNKPPIQGWWTNMFWFWIVILIVIIAIILIVILLLKRRRGRKPSELAASFMHSSPTKTYQYPPPPQRPQPPPPPPQGS